jgi:hypothetical protein
VSFTASCAAPTGRVPGLRGAYSSSPVHRALVLVLGTNIAVLLDCSKSSRQCSLPYLLTYAPWGVIALRWPNRPLAASARVAVVSAHGDTGGRAISRSFSARIASMPRAGREVTSARCIGRSEVKTKRMVCPCLRFCNIPSTLGIHGSAGERGAQWGDRTCFDDRDLSGTIGRAVRCAFDWSRSRRPPSARSRLIP